jgi:hypothetical protein
MEVILLVKIHGINELVPYLDLDSGTYFKFRLILDPLVCTSFHPVFISRPSSVFFVSSLLFYLLRSIKAVICLTA